LDGRHLYSMKTRDEYCRDRNVTEPVSKRYFSETRLADILNAYPIKSKLSSSKMEEEKCNRRVLIDFLKGLLNINPIERWSPQQAKRHPYITGEPFEGPFLPPISKNLLPVGIKSPKNAKMESSEEMDSEFAFEDDHQILYESDYEFQSPYIQKYGRLPSRNQPNPSPSEPQLIMPNNSQRRSSAPSIFGFNRPPMNLGTSMNYPPIGSSTQSNKPIAARKSSIGSQQNGRRMSVQHYTYGNPYPPYLSHPPPSYMKPLENLSSDSLSSDKASDPHSLPKSGNSSWMSDMDTLREETEGEENEYEEKQ